MIDYLFAFKYLSKISSILFCIIGDGRDVVFPKNKEGSQKPEIMYLIRDRFNIIFEKVCNLINYTS